MEKGLRAIINAVEKDINKQLFQDGVIDKDTYLKANNIFSNN